MTFRRSAQTVAPRRFGAGRRIGALPGARLRQGLGAYAAALAAVALVSLVIGAVLRQRQIANISMLYLIAVLVTATAFGRGPAILASVAAFLTFNFFFVEPFHTFTVSDPQEWVSLLFFLLTAIVTGQLAADQRRRADEARQREREAVALYDTARLLAEPDLAASLTALAERLRVELGLVAVVIDVGPAGQLPLHAEAGHTEALELARAGATAPAQLLSAGPAPTGARRGATGRWVRLVPPQPPGREARLLRTRLNVVPIKVAGERIGTLLVVREPGDAGFGAVEDRLLSAVATHVGLAIQRVRLQREATEAEILRRTDELRTALLNAVSHDLRTPLASIIASAGSLLQRDVEWTEEERREFAEAIESEARRLNGIVGNLLDLSRIEAGSLRPEKGWYDLGALVDDVLGRLRPLTAAHHLVVSVPDDLPPVPLDYVEIGQVLSNLIENAAKYTRPGTEIEVTVRPTGDEVEVEVADHGPGIPPAALARLFEPFYRVEGPGPRPRGTGLGLAVVRGLVEAHGGRIWVENRAGGGARFVFTLPVSHQTRAAPPTGGGA